MKHNWEYKQLGDIAPSTPFKGIISSANGKYWCLNLDKIESNTGVVLEYDFVDGTELGGSVHKFTTDNVLFSKLRPNLNKVVVPEQNGYCTTELVPLHPLNILNRYYLAYYLRSPKYVNYIVGKTGGAKMPRVKMDIFWNSKIPVPPMAVQKQIVAELDKINEVIEDCRELLRNLDALAKSLFYDFFGDPVTNPKGFLQKSIGEFASVKIGPFGSLVHKEDYVCGGTPLVNPIHMQNGRVKIDNDFTIDDTKKKVLLNYLLKSGDIVFGRRGDIGRCALITDNEDGYLCGTGSLFVRFNIKINPIFALWCCRQRSVKAYLTEKAKGATMLNINCGIIESAPIILPPLTLQEQFSARIEQIEVQKKTIEETIANLQTLLDSRMDYWFN